MISTQAVLAVALGLTGVQDQAVQTVRVDRAAVARAVGHYSETVDRAGTTHLRGTDRTTGAAFDVTIAKDGRVDAQVGPWVRTFRVSHAG